MVGKIAAQSTQTANEGELSLRFGGGLNTRASSDEIDERECTEGINFDLDIGNSQFRPRKPFDLAWTAPNSGRINGFAQLVDTGGNLTTIIQAAGNVYSTDFYTDVLVGTVSTAARLRGHRSHTWNLTDEVLIADLALAEPVRTWNGTYLGTMSHGLVGNFLARYIHVDNERAFFANVSSNGVVTPHVVIASEISDYSTISTENRPQSSLGEGDAWYLPMPDLRPINGMAGALGVLVFSTQRGAMHKLVGSTSKDYEVKTLHYDSYATGNESVTFVGNDIAYGRAGRIESLVGVEAYGDVETNDLSLKIADSIADFSSWALSYSSRHQRIYCSPVGEPELWVFHKPLAETTLSPWIKWTTLHSMAFQPTFMWSMLDPQSGLEHVFMGDDSGHIYRMEGTGASGDGGTTDIAAYRTSKLVSAPGLSAAVYDVQGNLKFRPVIGDESVCNITMMWQGYTSYDKEISVPMIAARGGSTWGGTYYFGNGTAYGSRYQERLLRERFAIAGQGAEVQLKTEITGTAAFEINEVYCGYRAAG